MLFKKNLVTHALFTSAISALCLGTAHATPLIMNATYFTVAGTYGAPGSGDPDFNTNPCCGSYYTNEVQNTLGPDGLPVYNASYGGPTLYDVNSNGELTWWSPSQNPYVTQTGTGTVTLPYANYSMFPPNGTGSNDYNGFQTAIFRAVLTVPTTESVTFSFGADDDAFLALGNSIISQEGGIHGVSAAPVTTSILNPGNYDLSLFYADRHVTGAGLYFAVDTTNVGINPPPTNNTVPEPATLALMGLGLAGLGWTRRRKT